MGAGLFPFSGRYSGAKEALKGQTAAQKWRSPEEKERKTQVSYRFLMPLSLYWII